MCLGDISFADMGTFMTLFFSINLNTFAKAAAVICTRPSSDA